MSAEVTVRHVEGRPIEVAVCAPCRWEGIAARSPRSIVKVHNRNHHPSAHAQRLLDERKARNAERSSAAPIPRAVTAERYPQTRSVRAQAIRPGDVLVLDRGAPLLVIEVQPAKGTALLTFRVSAVDASAGGPSQFVGPFLPDQIVQRAVRR
jgi:hypothetical protein